MNKIDQFGESIPNDLVTLPNPKHLNPSSVILIEQATWYCANNVLLVSAREIRFLSQDNPLDSGVDINTVEIIKVSPQLHRWSYEDGFYHS